MKRVLAIAAVAGFTWLAAPESVHAQSSGLRTMPQPKIQVITPTLPSLWYPDPFNPGRLVPASPYGPYTPLLPYTPTPYTPTPYTPLLPYSPTYPPYVTPLVSPTTPLTTTSLLLNPMLQQFLQYQQFNPY